jgi:hypothetical protein
MSRRGCGEFGADLLAEDVERDGGAAAAEVPVGPAVAGGRAFEGGADLVDRAAHVRGDQRAVGAHARGMAAVQRVEGLAGRDQAAREQLAEGDARLGAPGRVVAKVSGSSGATRAMRASAAAR